MSKDEIDLIRDIATGCGYVIVFWILVRYL